jgi:hypothetical protein
VVRDLTKSHKLHLCLEIENNRRSAESKDFYIEGQRINLETNHISQEIQKLNRKGTEAAMGTVLAAQDTSRSTRANVLVGLNLLPLFNNQKLILLACMDHNTSTHCFAIFWWREGHISIRAQHQVFPYRDNCPDRRTSLYDVRPEVSERYCRQNCDVGRWRAENQAENQGQ